MQFAAGMPNLTGQTISTPDSSDSSCSSTDITIRLTTQVDPHIYHYHESDDASETVWNEVHWAEPDWKDADHQAQVVKAKKSVLTPRV